MTIQIPPSEWEALSSYLDNQLSERDRSRLETRLKSEPELRQALEDLRRTRIILRNQPRLRAPRNFTLTAATAGVRSRRSSPLAGWLTSPFVTLRFASVLAAVFLVLITVGDLAVRRYAPAPTTVSMSDQANRPIMGLGGGGGGGGVDVIPQPVPTEEAAMEAMPAAPALASEIPDHKALVVTPLGSPETAAMDASERSAKEPPQVMEGPPVAGVEVQLPAPQPDTTAPAAQETPPASSLIRALQALLILLAVGAGIAALALRRNAG